jgi:hypothetical protein
MTVLPDDSLAEILSRHRDVWRRRSMLILANAVCASLIVGAIVGGLVMSWLRS